MHHAPARIASLAIAPDPRGGWRFARAAGPDPARLLVGRTPQEAARLVPLVFNLCGAAHGRAAAAALGLAVDPALSAHRLAQETARDHARAILLDWPLALGFPPDRDSLGLLARPDGAEALIRALAGEAGDLAALSLADLAAWLAAGETGTARLLAHLRREVDAQEGRVALPLLTAGALAAALRPSPSAGVRDSGRTNGEPPHEHALAPAVPAASDRAGADSAPADASLLYETGALGRTASRPLLAALLAIEGRSLFARLLARLIDGLDALRGTVPDTPAAPPGIGLAEAARGLLGHGARVAEDRVAAYTVLSPSAWNLAPGGLLERAFAALTPGPQARRLAPLLISAINPCVPVTLTLGESADA